MGRLQLSADGKLAYASSEISGEVKKVDATYQLAREIFRYTPTTKKYVRNSGSSGSKSFTGSYGSFLNRCG